MASRPTPQQVAADKAAAHMAAPAKRMVETTPRPKASGGKVTIACKLPVPWLDLRITKLVEKEQSTQSGVRTVREAEDTGAFIRVRGTAYPQGNGAPEGFPARPIMVNGFALTANVDEDKWEAWLDQGGGRNSQMFKSGVIYAYTSLDDVRSKAKELRDIKTGLEPLDPRTDSDGKSMDPRAPRKTVVGRTEVGQVNKEADDEARLYELLSGQAQHQDQESLDRLA